MGLPQKRDEFSSVFTEYSVYIYHDRKKQPTRDTDWEKKSTTTNKLRALAQAKKLHASNDYERVEIKKKILDPMNDRAFDITYKVYEKSRKFWQKHSFIAFCAGILTVAGFSAILVTLFL